MELKQNKILQFNNKQISKLSQKFNLEQEIIKLLFLRGIDSEEKIDKFLNPGISSFYNPFLLKNMDKVAIKIKDAITNNSRITILGDYDTDGISASAILSKFLQSKGNHPDVFLPNRFVDGYGLNNDTIDKINESFHPDLIITVDCGISCYKEVDYCKSLGIDIIVTDHHDIPEIIPNTLVIDAKLPNQDYPFKELCGAGVAFKVVQAVAGLSEALNYTTIAALATVADIVPLVDENRAIVFHGLAHQENLPIGLVSLCKKCDIPLPLTASTISFKLAPKINATGRMGDAKISYQLYDLVDELELDKYINELLALNDKRLQETNVIYDDAIAMLDKVNVTKMGIIVLYNPNWESGVLGIIASKLVEKFNKPVCLLSRIDDEIKGSCRSIQGINIYEVLDSAKDLLIRFGGHNQAGGLSLYLEHLDDFIARVNEFILAKYDFANLKEVRYYDMDLTKIKITTKLISELDKLEPFGLNNPRPVFKLNVSSAVVTRLPNYPQHLRIKNNIEILAFNYGKYYYNFTSNCLKEVLIDIYNDEWAGKVKPKAIVKCALFGRLVGSTKQDIVNSQYIQQLKLIDCPEHVITHIATLSENSLFDKLNDLLKSEYGTVILSYNFELYDKLLKHTKLINNFELYNITNETGINTIVFAPNYDNNYTNYDNIVLLDPPIDNGFLNSLSNSHVKIWVVNTKQNKKLFKDIQLDRKSMGIYHNIIKNYAQKNVCDLDKHTMFINIAKQNPQFKSINYTQFVFCLMVFEELGIINILYDNGIKILYNNNIQTELNTSKIYNYVSALIK